MKARIRNAAGSDVPAMHRIRLGVRENRLSEPGRVTEASYLPFLEAKTIWAAETDSGIVGFAAVDAATNRVWALFVDPDREGAGIGRALNERILEWAQAEKVRRLTLSTAAGSRAEAFYARAGWTRAGLTAEGEVRFEMDLG